MKVKNSSAVALVKTPVLIVHTKASCNIFSIKKEKDECLKRKKEYTE